MGGGSGITFTFPFGGFYAVVNSRRNGFVASATMSRWEAWGYRDGARDIRFDGLLKAEIGFVFDPTDKEYLRNGYDAGDCLDVDCLPLKAIVFPGYRRGTFDDVWPLRSEEPREVYITGYGHANILWSISPLARQRNLLRKWWTLVFDGCGDEDANEKARKLMARFEMEN